MDERDIKEDFEKLDNGEYLYNKIEERLMALPDGHKIGFTLAPCTICPVHNGTCTNAIDVSVYGFHPEKGLKETRIALCSLDVDGDGDGCPLNK